MAANMISPCSTSSPSPISTSARWRTRASTSSTRATSWPTPTPRPTPITTRSPAVVAHEYFHNWSGNRVTCRDWFQLSLKEGFTVFRDQSFSADMGSPAVKRIEDVRVLRAAQFPEDAGPLAHPVRPDSYIEISNFYTATVYNKGAELIRMMHTILGPEKFRAGCRPLFRAARRRGGDLRGFRPGDGGCERRRPRALPRSGTARPARRRSRRGSSQRRRARRASDARAGACRRRRASRPSSRCRSRSKLALFGARERREASTSGWSLLDEPSAGDRRSRASPSGRCCRSTATSRRRSSSRPTAAPATSPSSRRTTTIPSPATRRCSS